MRKYLIAGIVTITLTYIYFEEIKKYLETKNTNTANLNTDNKTTKLKTDNIITNLNTDNKTTNLKSNNTTKLKVNSDDEIYSEENLIENMQTN
jgi:hypothetical protein